MTASWETLFERGGAYDVSLEAIRETADDLEGDDD